MFYFGSPSKQPSNTFKYASSPCVPPLHLQRRRGHKLRFAAASMDFSTERAFVARLGEPVFTSSNTYAFCQPLSTVDSHDTVECRHNADGAGPLDHIHITNDHDDDNMSDVIFTASSVKCTMDADTMNDDDVKPSSVSDVDNSTNDPSTSTMLPASISVQGLHSTQSRYFLTHDRPVSAPGLRRSRAPSVERRHEAEQEVRRLRFAFDHDAALSSRRRSIATYEPSSFTVHLPEDERMHNDVSSQSLPEPSLLTYPVQSFQHFLSNFSASNTHRINALLSASRDIHEDALAVDHPSRSYDVADFLHKWRSESLFDDTLPPIDVGFDDSLPILSSLQDVTRADLVNGNVDMQGISWTEQHTERQYASRARFLLHPAKRSRSFPSQSEDLGQLDERYYRPYRFHGSHRAKFAHYQLRNVLAAHSRNDIFYASGGTITSTSLAAPHIQNPLVGWNRPSTTSFRITCLAASVASNSKSYNSDRVLFAGGFNGEYALINLDSPSTTTPTEGFVTHAYNGLVTHISTYHHRRSGLLQAAFCTNDARVRLMDVPTLTFTGDFTYSSAINASDISPDGRLRVLVGDSCETLITDAEKGNPLVTLSSHTDHGFACDWARDGIHVATGAQDGKVMLWDARNWSAPLDTIDCLMSCARSLRFADDSTLVVAEEDDVVSFYNPASRHRQDVRFFGSVAGIALLDGGEEVVVANADRTVGGLLILQKASDVVDQSSPPVFDHVERRRLQRERSRGRKRVLSFTRDISSDPVFGHLC